MGIIYRKKTRNGQIAQLVEHRTENPGVAGSIPALPTTLSYSGVRRFRVSNPKLSVVSKHVIIVQYTIDSFPPLLSFPDIRDTLLSDDLTGKISLLCMIQPKDFLFLFGIYRT